MLAVTEYRALLDRFFVLARMEKRATIKLRMATDMRGKKELLATLDEELFLIHQEKLKLLTALQKLMLTSGTAPLFFNQGQLQAAQLAPA